MGLSRSDIELSYELFLGRAPSEQEIDRVRKNQSSLDSLRNLFLKSDEFRKVRGSVKTSDKSYKSAKKTIIHLHVPKSAGSSLSRLLANDTTANGRITVGDNTLKQLTNLPVARQRELTLIFGHLRHGIAKKLPQQCHYVSVLREPGPRVLSFYRYVERTDHHPLYETVHGQKMSFGDFLEFTEATPKFRMEVDNGQIRRLGGDMANSSLGRENALLRRALHNVFAPNFTYGLTEYFDNFQKRLVRQGLLSASKSIRENAAGVPGDLTAALAELTPAQRAIYDSYIRWDTQFYDICKTVYFANRNSKEQPL